jgi:hypothetical protein
LRRENATTPKALFHPEVMIPRAESDSGYANGVTYQSEWVGRDDRARPTLVNEPDSKTKPERLADHQTPKVHVLMHGLTQRCVHGGGVAERRETAQ